jgi:hypothetical protein
MATATIIKQNKNVLIDVVYTPASNGQAFAINDFSVVKVRIIDCSPTASEVYPEYVIATHVVGRARTKAAAIKMARKYIADKEITV